MKKLIFEAGDYSVRTNIAFFVLQHVAFYTENLNCPDSVIEKVVGIYNENIDNYGNILMKLGNYLMNEPLITQDDREWILEKLKEFIQLDINGKLN